MKKLLILFFITLTLSATAQKSKEDFKGDFVSYLDSLNIKEQVDEINIFVLQIEVDSVGLVDKINIFYEDSTGLRSIPANKPSRFYSLTDLLKGEKNKPINLSAKTYVMPFVLVYFTGYDYEKIDKTRILTSNGIEQMVRLLNAAKSSKSELLTPVIVFIEEYD
jgi:hypothetical protein